MICERCLMETNIVRPFRIVLREKERSIGYLKFCPSCYYARSILDTIIVIGFVTLLIMLVCSLLYGHATGANWITYGVCIAFGVIEIKLTFYLIRNAGYPLFREQLIECLADRKTTVEMVCYKDQIEKLRTIVIDTSKLIFYILAISLVWIVYTKFANAISNATDSSGWHVLAHMALFVSSVISGLCVWFFCHVFFYDLVNDIRTPTKDVLEKLKEKHQANRDAMKNADRNVYRDPGFTHVDNYMTYIVFGGKGSDSADPAGGRPGGQVSRVMTLIEGCLKSGIFGHLSFLHKARERAAGDRGELDKAGPSPSSHR